MNDAKLTVTAEKRARVLIAVGHDTVGRRYRMAIASRKKNKKKDDDEPIMLTVRSNGAMGVIAEGDLSTLDSKEVYRFELEEDRRALMSGIVKVQEKLIS